MLVAFPLGFLLSFSGPVPGGARARPTQGTMLIGLMILMLIGVELCGLLLPTRALNTIDMLVSAAGALAGLAAGTQLSRCWQTA